MSTTPQLAGTPVLILREGSSRETGRGAQHANIMAASIVAEAVKSALGPKGMDKMLVDSFGDITITSDGRTILDEMDIQHPAAKMMVEVAKTQDDEVGDGTTSSVIIAGELLSQAEDLLNKNVHPTIIIDGYRKAAQKALEILEKIAIKVDPEDKNFLQKVAMTAMGSKLVAGNREYLAGIVTSAILHVAQKNQDNYTVDLDNILVEKKPGESLTETKLVEGLLIDKEVVHSGMPKRVDQARILLLDTALEIEKTEFDAKINIESPEQMDSFLKQEENMIQEMVEKITALNASVVLCQKGIDDLAQHFLARKSVLAIRRVKKSDMEKLAKAIDGNVVSNLNEMTKDDLGFAELVEERKIGEDKMVFIEGCKNPHAVAILIRGGTERIVDEAERSIHDALCVVQDVVQEPKILAGGGSPEMELAKNLRDYAQSLPGREHLAVQKYAEAVEIIPTILSENAGIDPIDMISELRAHHENNKVWMGVNVEDGKAADMKQLDILEPLVVRKQIIKSATEATTMILKIDDVIASGKSKAPPMPPGGPGGYGGMGGGMGGMPPEY
jgi:thermosome